MVWYIFPCSFDYPGGEAEKCTKDGDLNLCYFGFKDGKTSQGEEYTKTDSLNRCNSSGFKHEVTLAMSRESLSIGGEKVGISGLFITSIRAKGG